MGYFYVCQDSFWSNECKGHFPVCHEHFLCGGKDKFVVFYMDDITVYSRSDRKHIRHLEKVFLKSKKYGISLNPRKSNFALEEGKLLGHIISKDGIKIDPERIKEILKVEEPRSKKEVQSFIGQVNFLRSSSPILLRY